MAERRPVVVVVGAGSAGSVVAGTLAASGACSVVLLEAGSDHALSARPSSVSGPSFVSAMAEPGFTWPDLPAVRVTGQEPRRYVRGRGLGGSSAVNAMVALTGHPDDYDEWERDLGCDGWGWSDLAPWFDRVRSAHPLTEALESEIGVLGAGMVAADARAERALLTRDHTGARVTASDVFVEPWRASGRLDVRGGAEVRRVLLDGRRAAGVELTDGSVIEADAVIVCAGAIHSPTVLQRSAIDRPGVGRGLQDHPSFPLTLVLRDPVAMPTRMLSVGTLLRAAHREPDDLQVLAMDEVDPTVPGIGVLLGAVMRVWSRGSVALGSDPDGAPTVDFGMLSDERDMDAMRAVVGLVEQIAGHPAVAAIGDVVPHATDDEAIRASVGDYVHATSTCRMGPVDGEDSVVDVSGRVIGYDSLWVVDASVMPRVPRANTHLPTMALALRLATEWVDRTR
ncbi:MAG: hypothetical protein RJB65_2353 [Actinomycetota bacterium]